MCFPFPSIHFYFQRSFQLDMLKELCFLARLLFFDKVPIDGLDERRVLDGAISDIHRCDIVEKVASERGVERESWEAHFKR